MLVPARVSFATDRGVGICGCGEGVSSDFSVMSSTLDAPSSFGLRWVAFRGEGEGVALSVVFMRPGLSFGDGTLITSFLVDERMPFVLLPELSPWLYFLRASRTAGALSLKRGDPSDLCFIRSIPVLLYRMSMLRFVVENTTFRFSEGVSARASAGSAALVSEPFLAFLLAVAALSLTSATVRGCSTLDECRATKCLDLGEGLADREIDLATRAGVALEEPPPLNVPLVLVTRPASLCSLS